MAEFVKTGTAIYIHRHNGWVIIAGDAGNCMRYLYYTRREALRRFKEQYGYKYKHGIKVEVV